MAEKTVKVDEAVHNRLEELKQNYGVETFNEVLRYELEIITPPSIDRLAAFLHDDLQEIVTEIIEDIRDIGEFEERVKENGGKEILEFVPTDSNRVIASVEFDESQFQVRYRSQKGDMKSCGRGWYSTTGDKPRYGRRRDTSDYTEPADVIEQANIKITGAHKRWVA